MLSTVRKLSNIRGGRGVVVPSRANNVPGKFEGTPDRKKVSVYNLFRSNRVQSCLFCVLERHDDNAGSSDTLLFTRARVQNLSPGRWRTAIAAAVIATNLPRGGAVKTGSGTVTVHQLCLYGK